MSIAFKPGWNVSTYVLHDILESWFKLWGEMPLVKYQILENLYLNKDEIFFSKMLY